MAYVKISELPAATALTGAEQVPIVQNGVTARTTTQDIFNGPDNVANPKYVWDGSNLSARTLFTTQAIASGDINTGTGVITWVGLEVRTGFAFLASGGAGLAANTVYYGRRVTDSTFTVHTSYNDAYDGVGLVSLVGVTAFTLKVLRDPIGAAGSEGFYRIRAGDAKDGSQGAFVYQGRPTPPVFGASTLGVPCAAQVQAWLNFCRYSWDATANHFMFPAVSDNGVYTVERGVQVVGLRQPYFPLRNLKLYVTTSDTGLDFAGTNSPRISNVVLYGDRTAMSQVGLYVGRLYTAGDAPIAPNTVLDGVTIWGYWGKAAFVNAASEDSVESGGCLFGNANPNTTAVTKIYFGDMQDVIDVGIAAITSKFTALPPAGVLMSNISHHVDLNNCVREQDVFIPLTNISKSNPAVCSFTPGTFSANRLSNGQSVFFDVEGMTQIDNQTLVVSNLNLAAGTFEVPVNSTAYSTFTSGSVRNKTGHALVLASIDKLNHIDGYFLAYGVEPIAMVMRNHPISDLLFEAQAENAPASVIKIYMPTAGTQTMQGVRMRLNMWNQPVSNSVITDDAAGGSIRIDGADIVVSNMPVAPTFGVFRNPASYSLYKANIEVPLANALNAPTAYAAFQGYTTAYDRSQREIGYGGHLLQGTTAVAPLTLQVDDDGGGAGPDMPLYRNSASPASNDILGRMLFRGNSSTGVQRNYAYLRGRIQTPTNGAENGFVDLVQYVNGVETQTHQWRGGMYSYNATFTVATLPTGGAGATAGSTAYATNLRVFNAAGVQQGAGLGTGGMVVYNGTRWVNFDAQDVTAVA